MPVCLLSFPLAAKPVNVLEPCSADCYGTWVVSYGACTGSPGQTCGRASIPVAVSCDTGNEAECDPSGQQAGTAGTAPGSALRGHLVCTRCASDSLRRRH